MQPTRKVDPPLAAQGSLKRSVAGALARSALLSRGRLLWERNEKDRNLALTRSDKLWAGAYIILRDYAGGDFPPVFCDQAQVHWNEVNYRTVAAGSVAEITARFEMLKPFWLGPMLRDCFRQFLKLTECLTDAGLNPPAKLLELGGGAGWTAEFLAQLGYQVVSTTISPDDVQSGLKRVEALRLKGLQPMLQFVPAPMETVADHVTAHCPFDGVFVLAALHHAFDWRATIQSSFQCLKAGGWLLVCDEPNVLHTAISYRVARLANTHEIGFGKRELVGHLRQTGFRRVLSRGKQPHFFCRPHWLLAQK